MMTLGYFADGPWAHRALEKIRDIPSLKILFIVGRFQTTDQRLRRYAEEWGIPFFVHRNVNSKEFLGWIREFQADLFVSMSFDQIFKAEFLSSTSRGVINCHAGALPFYRGRNVLNWALINGEKKIGITVHHVDQGIDTGDIILQRFIDILPDDDYGTLLDKAAVSCAEVLCEALLLLERGKAPRIPQSSLHPTGSYCVKRKQGDEVLDWSWDSERIHNFVRALTTPGPGARTWLGEKEWVVYKTAPFSEATSEGAIPGEVIGQTPDGIIVKTGDSSLLICRAGETEGNSKKEARQLSAGTRFKNNGSEIAR